MFIFQHYLHQSKNNKNKITKSTEILRQRQCSNVQMFKACIVMYL